MIKVANPVKSRRRVASSEGGRTFSRTRCLLRMGSEGHMGIPLNRARAPDSREPSSPARLCRRMSQSCHDRAATALLVNGRQVLVGPNSCGGSAKRPDLAVAVVRRDVVTHRPGLSAPLAPHPETISSHAPFLLPRTRGTSPGSCSGITRRVPTISKRSALKARG
jgi:hypothetical protein